MEAIHSVHRFHYDCLVIHCVFLPSNHNVSFSRDKQIFQITMTTPPNDTRGWVCRQKQPTSGFSCLIFCSILIMSNPFLNKKWEVARTVYSQRFIVEGRTARNYQYLTILHSALRPFRIFNVIIIIITYYPFLYIV